MFKNKINNMKISGKLWLLVGLSLFGCVLIESFSLYDLKRELLEDRKTRVEVLVDSAHSVIALYVEKELRGELSRSEAQQQALAAIGAMRYEGSNYFWVNDYQARMIMHPIKPQLNGQDLSGNKDAAGKLLFTAMADVVKQNGSGFVDYMWTKPGSDQPVDKLSYVKGHGGWQWIVGTGIYVDDVQTVFWQVAAKLIGLTLLILALLVALSWVLVRAIVSPIHTIQLLLQKVEQHGDFSLRTNIEQQDEIGQMAQSLNNMLATQQRAISELNKVVSSVAKGDLNQRITIDLKGDLQTLQQGVNTSINQISGVLTELSDVMGGLSHGNFQKQVATNSQGIYLDIAESTNTAMAAMTASITAVRHTMQEMAQGNFDVRINREMEGDFNDLKNHVNRSLGAVDQSIKEILQVIQAMAENNLGSRVQGQYEGQLAQLSEAMNSSLDKLVRMILEVQKASMEVATATGQLTSGSEQLSNRAQQQASTLDQTSSSMNAMNSSVHKNSSDVAQASVVLKGVERELEQAMGVMDSTVNAMDLMQQSSKKVGTIIEMINEVAFQTNLLALNAAVEAARAGEHGRGFAVVASEVQGLAKRSALASKEIQDLVNDTLERTNEGISLVQKSGTAMAQVGTSMTEVNAIMAEIADASQTQSTDISKVSQAVSSLEADTQQNAALAEETLTATHSIADQAESLGVLVKRFVISPGPASVASTEPESSRAPQPVG